MSIFIFILSITIDYTDKNKCQFTGVQGTTNQVMDTSSSSLQLTFTATLKGHSGWVTAIATPSDPTMNFIVSSSRGKLLIKISSKWMDGCTSFGLNWDCL